VRGWPRRTAALLTAVALVVVAVLAASSVILASHQVTSVVNKQVETTAAVSSVVIGQQTTALLTLVHSYATRPFAYREWFTDLVATGRPYISSAIVTKQAAHTLAITVTDYIRGRDGKPIGVLGINYSLASLQTFADSISRAQGIVLQISDRKGTSLTAGGQRGLGSIAGDRRVQAALKGQTGLLEYRPPTAGGGRGAKELSAYAPVRGTGWAVIASIPAHTAFAGLVRLRTTVYAITAVLVLVLLAGAGVIARAGRRRRESESQVQRRDRELARVLDSTDEAFVSFDGAGAITGWNARAELLYGWSADEVMGRKLIETVVPPKHRLEYARELAEYRTSGQSMLVGARTEGTAQHRDGHLLSVEVGLWAHEEDDGFSAFVHDISARVINQTALEEERGRLIEAQRVGQLGSFECEFATDSWSYSRQMAVLFGVEWADLSRELVASLILESDRDLVHESWEEALRLGGRHSKDFRIRRRSDDAHRVIRGTNEIELDADGQPVRGRSTYLDITDITAAEQAAKRANAFFDAVLAATPDFTTVSDLVTGALLYVSRDRDILGVSAASIQALHPAARTELVHPEDRARLVAINAAAADLADGQVLQLRYRAQHEDGTWRWLSRRITPFRRDDAGAVVEVLGVIRDISDVMESEDRLTQAALHDSLTGLPNRALLIDRLEAALARSARDGREVAVLFCDLDGFKRVNDMAGHAAGDALLVEIGQRMQDVLREYDTVARVGGDEFVMIVEPWNRADRAAPGSVVAEIQESDRTLALRVAERVSAALQQPVRIKGVDHVVSASIGITYASLGPGGRAGPVTAEQVLQDADTAMYVAKGRGKDRFEVFEHGLHNDLAERGRVERLLREALSQLKPDLAMTAGTLRARGTPPTFSAAYQPVFDSGTGTLMGFEALARLTDAAGLEVSPDVFIAIAEETGIIHALGRTMLELACAQMRAWRVEIPGLERVSMAVNVSALQAQHASLADDVRTALQTHGLSPSDLVLELTETALLQVANSTITALRTLRAEGVGIAIDDFGIGYASLRYLATLPVSAVKIDRSFTAGLPHDQTSRKIVKAVAGLAEDMQLICIVEGVETDEQRAALPLGVYLQGFLTGRPQSPESMDVLTLCTEGRR
jgi:diguanylate cyclase (GGDEF)-like protein/PAS domain S-box-containing protein